MFEIWKLRCRLSSCTAVHAPHDMYGERTNIANSSFTQPPINTLLVTLRFSIRNAPCVLVAVMFVQFDI